MKCELNHCFDGFLSPSDLSCFESPHAKSQSDEGCIPESPHSPTETRENWPPTRCLRCFLEDTPLDHKTPYYVRFPPKPTLRGPSWKVDTMPGVLGMLECPDAGDDADGCKGAILPVFAVFVCFFLFFLQDPDI